MFGIFNRKSRTIAAKSHQVSTVNDSDDRRDSGRATCDLFINRFLDGHPYLCVAVDVSRTGMRMRPLSGPNTEAETVGLQFQLPGSPQVYTASARTVRTDDGGLALHFTHLAPGADAALDRFVQNAA